MNSQGVSTFAFIRSKAVKLIKLVFWICLIALLTLWGVRIYNAWRSPPLQLWHTFVPNELTSHQMDQSTWPQYMERENQLFEAVRTQVTDRLPPEVRVQTNRYYSGAIIYPPSFERNWNRSYVLEPEGKIVGAVVLLHGLTDTPYSLRHVAMSYRDQGFLAIGLRVPAHGTVPAALTAASWEEWMAGTRLAIREATRRAGPGAPLHVVGFSNGGALAIKYALDALENPKLSKPDRLVLLSPMVGITRFARFAGISGMPAVFPAFAKLAWLGLVPEFNPFKYNSFPVNGARQSYRLTRALQDQIGRLYRSGQLVSLPPVTTFQSVMDYTVSTSAIINALYAYLPENGSELILFDINRATLFNPLIRSASDIALVRMIPPAPRRYDLTVIGNANINDAQTVSRTTLAGQKEEKVTPLGITYPPYIFSLSHVAIPFPMNDPLYGMTPSPEEKTRYGVSLGTMAARGERGALIVNMDSLFRTTSNPFFPYMIDRIVLGIKDPMPLRGKIVKPYSTTEITVSPFYQQDIERFLAEDTLMEEAP